MNPTLAVYDKDSEDAGALSELLLKPEIWDGMRVDKKTQEEIAYAKWPGTILSIWRHDETKDPVGFQIFIPRMAGAYEMHVGFIEAARGKEALAAVTQIVHRMFMESDASEIYIQCPDWNPHAALFAGTLDARRLFKIDHYAERDGVMRGAIVFTRNLADWIFEHAAKFYVPACDVIGKNDTEVHMRSAVVEMAKHQPSKAQAFFNLYCALSGQNLIAVTPIPGGSIVTFHDLRIIITGGKVAFSEEILPCR